MTGPAPSSLSEFLQSLPFPPDPFQVRALEGVACGRSVVVTAPTGAGKTLIAEGAIAQALSNGLRSFYTTPIKALSNQKFNDLTATHGAAQVGLLTGDSVIHADAPIVVMTTEVLRNMIYDESSALDHLGLVVLDEVHYLADRHRGSVWEEVIIHLDRSIPIVCLSATIANPEEFTAWVTSRRGATDLVVETTRPVPLTSMYMWRDRNHNGAIAMSPVFDRRGRPNPSIGKLLGRGSDRHRRFSTPRRTAVVEQLLSARLLPAIYFVFSRKGCDDTARHVASGGLKLTTPDERRKIRSIVDRHVAHLSPDDLTVLGFQRWRTMLEHGAAAHHAGLIPAFKETIEELFLEGLVKLVAATETLALGINMPAKTVILESLSKFNGDTHELLRPSDYTQLTGRAGRRGIDVEGTAVVLHSRYVPFDRVSAIAAAGANPLRSSFAPTYNMSVNLIARYDAATAHRLLSGSFANFSDTYRVKALHENLEERKKDLATFRAAAACELGDVWSFADEHEQAPNRVILSALLQPGGVIDISGKLSVILGRSWGGSRPRIELMDTSAKKRTVASAELPASTVVIGDISLPEPIRVSDPTYRSEIAARLESFVPTQEPRTIFNISPSEGVESCPDLDDHLRWIQRSARVSRDIARLERRISRGSNNSISVSFDRLRSVLEHRGYTQGWALTAKGERLRGLYNELDLLLGDALLDGTPWSKDPAEFAAVASIFTYETRGGEAPETPKARFAAEPIARIFEIWESLSEVETGAGLTPSRLPDVGLVDTIHGWANGLDLDELFDEEDVRAGDFVRAARQLLDLLRQIRDGFARYSKVASAALAAIDRGVVSVEAPR